MKILIVNTWYYPNMLGGSEYSTKLLAENLVIQDYDVAIYSIDSNNRSIEIETINGVKVYRGTGGNYKKWEKNLGFFDKLKSKIKDVCNFKIKKEFFRVIKEFNPDVIHTNSLSGLSFYIWYLAKKKNIPVIHTIRDYSLYSPRGVYEKRTNRGFIYKFYLKLHQQCCRHFSKYVDSVTAPSEFTLDIFRENKFFKNAKKKVCVVNSVEYDKDLLEKNISYQQSKNNSYTTYLFVGRLLKIKGIEHLIESFKEINNPNYRLVICGDGDMQEYVTKAAADDIRIKYKGKLEKKELEKEYLNADILIIPSIWSEPFGRVVIEANLFGLPVIASNQGGIPEIIKTMKSGILYEAGNKQELKMKIEEMSKRKNYQKYYTSISKNMYIYSVEEQVEKFISLYKNISDK